MDNTKRWNPANIKKHEATDESDAYKNALVYKDMSICKKCHNIYHNKRWVHDNELYNSILKKKEEINYTICPACLKIETKFYNGVVELSGNFLFEHKSDILNLVRNTVERADYIDPLEKIENIEEDDKKKIVTIYTTSEDLAQRIGRNVEKAYNGDIDYSFSERDLLLRVYWKRDL
jgi:hypothetical protein